MDIQVLSNAVIAGNAPLDKVADGGGARRGGRAATIA